jgi:Zn-dependent M28 family amino/carboxypeptidase
MELARLLAAWVEAHPEATGSRRSIMFHAYGAEEIGLLGSRQYVFTPTVPGDSLYAMLNFDMVGRLRDQTLIIAGATTSAAWTGLLEAWRPDGVVLFYSDEGIDRSDHWSFISTWATPALHFFTGLHADYHTPADDPPLLNYGGMAQVTQLALGVLWDLATRPDAM